MFAIEGSLKKIRIFLRTDQAHSGSSSGNASIEGWGWLPRLCTRRAISAGVMSPDWSLS
jgi:hypothetical protein